MRLNVLLLLLFIPAFHALANPQVNAVMDLQIINASNQVSWLNEGFGKFRYGESTNVNLSHFGVSYNEDVSRKIRWHVSANYNEAYEHQAGIVEGWLRWKNDDSVSGHTIKFGAFFPPFSVENNGPVWSNPWTLNNSVINSWFGEELRTNGIELDYHRAGIEHGSIHSFNFTVASFFYNDPAGSILSWRGWASHDRLTGLSRTIPLPDSSQLKTMFTQQAPVVDPFEEVDGRPGFYAGTKWRIKDNFEVSLHHYDNRADETDFKSGQYAWDTDFTHLGLVWKPVRDLQVRGQRIEGETRMGEVGGRPAVWSKFSAWSLLLIKEFYMHRLTLRYERFEVRDLDWLLADNNNENGSNLAFGYSYAPSQRWVFSTELAKLKSERPGRRLYFDGELRVAEYQTLAGVRMYF